MPALGASCVELVCGKNDVGHLQMLYAWVLDGFGYMLRLLASPLQVLGLHPYRLALPCFHEVSCTDVVLFALWGWVKSENHMVFICFYHMNVVANIQSLSFPSCSISSPGCRCFDSSPIQLVQEDDASLPFHPSALAEATLLALMGLNTVVPLKKGTAEPKKTL